MALSHLPFSSDPDSDIDSLEPLPSSDHEPEQLHDPHCSCSPLLSMADDASSSSSSSPCSSFSSIAASQPRPLPSSMKKKNPRSLGLSLACPTTLGRNADERLILRRLCRQLLALKSLLPPGPSKASVNPSSIIADALEYKKKLHREIQLLLMALPSQVHQVKVIRRSTGCLFIKVDCEKKNGLLIALMEAMESLGLIFDHVNVSCSDCISIDAVASQKSSEGTEAHALRKTLLRLISRF